MKVQCDVCGKDEASVFCCADEAALCEACDLRVHRANKLAGKHRRLALSSSSPHSHPLCDICQEKRGFVFCQQDRAILCRDCDGPIHSANDLTMKHSRFLLTGIRLSSGPIAEAEAEAEEDLTSNGSTSTGGSLIGVANLEKPPTVATASKNGTSAAAAVVSADSSSISEYLIKMLPGYCVEDLLVDDAVTAAKDAFYKSNELMPFVEADLDCIGGGRFAAGVEELPIWVPHVPQAAQQPNVFCGGGSFSVHNYGQHCPGPKETPVKAAAQQSHGVKMGRERWSDDSFMVPQMKKTGSLSSKRHMSTSSAWDF